MAFIGISVPHETARILSELDVPGTKESISHFHITMIYLGSGVPIEQLTDAIKATFKVTAKTKPFSVSTSLVTCFPKNEDGVPIICRVNSDPLHDLRKRLTSAFSAGGVQYNKKYPDYKPHVTLAYAEEEIEERTIPTVTWGAHELVLWGGDEGDRKLIVRFPFSIVSRVASRYLEM